MTHTSYILTAWLVSAGGVALYCARLVQRGRQLSRVVPPERRRWIDSDAATRRAKR
jgi:hypothetical protein